MVLLQRCITSEASEASSSELGWGAGEGPRSSLWWTWDFFRKLDAIFTAPGQGVSGTGEVSPGLPNWPPPGSHFGYQFWYPKWEHGEGFPWKYKQSVVCPGPKTGPQNGNMELRKKTASWTPGRHHFSCWDPGAPGRPHDLKGRHIIFKWLGFFRHKSKQGQRAV